MWKETKTRSIFKTISWRVLATLTTMLLVYILIGDMTIALSVGGIEVVLKMIVYFFHERMWDKIKFGRKHYEPAVIWLTGLVRSGKAEIAAELRDQLLKKSVKVELVDGHTVRHIFPETGYTEDQVNEHIKRVGYLASKLEAQGVFVVASFVSPYRESRDFVKKICRNFIEVHISTPLEVCEKRDHTGIYKRARNGEIKYLPGVDVEFEAPEDPHFEINFSDYNKNTVQKIVKSLQI